MQEVSEQQSWSSAQAYTLAAVCLLIGIITGYILHAPAQAHSVTSAVMPAVEQQEPAGLAASATPKEKQLEAGEQAKPLLALLEKNPKDAALLAQIGAVYFAAHQFQTAQDYYSRSAAINRKDPSILIKLSSAYFYGGNGEKAAATLNHVLEMDPKNADALFNLGVLQWQVNGDPQAAIESWQKLLNAHPEHPHRSQVEQMIARAKMHMNIATADSKGKSTP